jgi:hypothetical protein
LFSIKNLSNLCVAQLDRLNESNREFQKIQDLFLNRIFKNCLEYSYYFSAKNYHCQKLKTRLTVFFAVVVINIIIALIFFFSINIDAIS